VQATSSVSAVLPRYLTRIHERLCLLSYAGITASVAPTTTFGSHHVLSMRRSLVTGSLRETYRHPTTRLNREAGIAIKLLIHGPGIATCARRGLSFRFGRLVEDEQVGQPRSALEALHHGAAAERE
jgi:hypothetical protein